jgi:hypothetical protein
VREYFTEITDPRQSWKTDNNLHEIIIMTICAVISDFDIGKIEWIFAKQKKHGLGKDSD